MDTSSFDNLPGRVFLDTNVVNLALDYGEQLHENADIPSGLPPRKHADVEALCGMFDTGRRASWQLAISPLTYREVSATNDPHRRHYLERWFAELWAYWREFMSNSSDLPTFFEAEETRFHLLASGILDVLPDVSDRVLICDAVTYSCDCFCTCDYKSILKHRDQLNELPLRIMSPAEWWAEILPWAHIWV